MKVFGLVFGTLAFGFVLSSEVISNVVQNKNISRAEYALEVAYSAVVSGSENKSSVYRNDDRHIYIGKSYTQSKKKSDYSFIPNSLWSSFLVRKVRMMDLKNLDYSSQAEYASITFSGIDFDECLNLKKVKRKWDSADLVTLNGYPLMELPERFEFKSSPCARGEHSNHITLYRQLNR